MTARPAGDDWLARLRARGALLEGHFNLSSGLHSPHYVQCARFLQYPADAEAAAREIVARLAPALGAVPDLVVSPAIGGIVLGHEVARAWGCRAVWAERAEGGDLALRRGFTVAPEERAIAVEDVVTTAGSLRELVAAIEGEGASVVGVASLVDRSGGAVTWRMPSVSLVRLEGVQCPAPECPLCAAGVPVVRPGSRPA